jgi:isopenicillin N synthase-like dioxygenase
MGGLQVQYEEQWLDVTPIPDAFVLNIGQMMARWSNGVLKATRHRVVIDHLTTQPRFSIPYFYNCNLDTVVAPLKDFLSPDPEKNLEPVSYGEHLEHTLLQNYGFSMPGK